MMLLGRALYGSGCESLYVTQTTILAHWFSGQRMSFALTMLVMCTRTASVSNTVIGPEMPSPQVAFGFGFVLCALSWAAAVVLIIIHSRYCLH